MTEPAVRHPVVARAFDRLCRLMECELAVHRRQLLASLTGRVLEIGAGNGINFHHYPATVDEVIAVEPEPYLRAKAQQAARRAPVPVTVGDGVAEALTVEDGSFDAAIASLVLCTVRDQERSLAELRRAVRPGGQLRFLEHVRAPRPRKARLQERLDRSGLWPWLAGDCHCARDTVSAIAAAGFAVEHVHAFALRPTWIVTNPYVLGIARGTSPYDDHAEALFAYLLRRTGSAEHAAELLAEVFASALASQTRARIGGPARAWLFGIAKHKVADLLRRGYVEDRARRRIGMAAVAFTDEELERAEQLIDLARGPSLLVLVEDLPVDQRDAVLARVVEERSYSAIAAEHGCSEQAARQRVSRGLSRLASWARAW